MAPFGLQHICTKARADCFECTYRWDVMSSENPKSLAYVLMYKYWIDITFMFKWTCQQLTPKSLAQWTASADHVITCERCCSTTGFELRHIPTDQIGLIPRGVLYWAPCNEADAPLNCMFHAYEGCTLICTQCSPPGHYTKSAAARH